ncbi:MAG: FAD/NAD(P)-binding oxidoreductase [Candidatus Zixiibacteriota bacterium]
MSSQTICILGGGIGGLVAANELRRLLPKYHRIVLVDRVEQHAFAPSFLWVMTGDRQSDRITRPIKSLLRPGVEFVHANVSAIDTERSRVEMEKGSLSYDYLVVAVGAELSPESVPGLHEAAHTFYTLNGASRLHGTLREFHAGRIAVVIASTPYKCPGAPLEGAMLIADYVRRNGRRERVAIDLYTPEPQPMPVAGPVLGNAVLNMLKSRSIEYHPLHKLVSVDPQKRQVTFEGKGSVEYDLLVAIPPHRSPSFVRQSNLANESGWLPVDRATLATKIGNIYAVGDVTAISIPGRWKSGVPLALPKAGVFAHVQASVVAHRIAAAIMDHVATESFCGDGYCMLEAGEDLAGFAYGNFFAEPSPDVKLKRIGKAWHVGKLLFEKWWLAPYGPRRALYKSLINLGSRFLGIPSNI